jgi:hypothetical protein
MSGRPFDPHADEAPILPEHVDAARRTLRRQRIVVVALLAVLGGGLLAIVGHRAQRAASLAACLAAAEVEAANAVAAFARGAPLPGMEVHPGRLGSVLVVRERPLLVVDGALVAAGRVCVEHE